MRRLAVLAVLLVALVLPASSPAAAGILNSPETWELVSDFLKGGHGHR
jgi:hypothetical protein